MNPEKIELEDKTKEGLIEMLQFALEYGKVHICDLCGGMAIDGYICERCGE